MGIRPIRRAVLCLAVTLVVGGGMAGTAHAGATGNTAAPSAHAVQAADSDRTWVVPFTRLHGFGRLGGGCYAWSSATLNETTRTLTVHSFAQSTSKFAACRARVEFTLQIMDWSGVGEVSKPYSRNIPTACATWDPSCPSTTGHTFTYELGDEEELLDLVAYAVKAR